MTRGDLAKITESVYSRTSCGTLIFTVLVSLNHFIALLFVDIVIQQTRIVYLYHCNVGKSHLDPIFKGTHIFLYPPEPVRVTTPKEFSSLFINNQTNKQKVKDFLCALFS